MKRIIKKYFMNEKFIIRFISLLTVGIILFTLVWFLSYYFLPDGFLKGKAVSGRIVRAEASNTLLAEWGKIAGYNLGAVCLLVLVNLILWFDLFPLGYVTVFGNLTLYSIYMGTNSFMISMPERMAPSFAIFARSGSYEMIGFLLVAAATYNQSRFALAKNSYRITSVPRLSLEQWMGLGFGIAIILLAAWREAIMIMAS